MGGRSVNNHLIHRIFHQLLAEGLIVPRDDGTYTITEKGRALAAQAREGGA